MYPIPRVPPVTSAVIPRRDQLGLSIGGVVLVLECNVGWLRMGLMRVGCDIRSLEWIVEWEKVGFDKNGESGFWRLDFLERVEEEEEESGGGMRVWDIWASKQSSKQCDCVKVYFQRF